MLDRDGEVIRIEAFRSWLEAQDNIGSLISIAEQISATRSASGGPDIAELASALADACYGAYIFDVADWRRNLRDHDAALKKQAKKLRAGLTRVGSTLLEHELRLWIITKAVETRLRQNYGNTFSLPEPQEFFVLDVLEALSAEIEPKPHAAGFNALPFQTCHGCLDYGRPIRGDQARDRRQMLAFNLVFLSRSATGGPWSVEGPMPRGGRPNFEIVARLVAATIPEGPKDSAVTADWVSSTVKSILHDNKLARVARWPTGRFRSDYDGWITPGVKLT